MDFTILIVIIVLALIFDYINGFHDAANAIATVVATKVLTPFQAVVWAAFFNFLAYWVFGFGVADTVAKTANTMEINLTVILAGIMEGLDINKYSNPSLPYEIMAQRRRDMLDAAWCDDLGIIEGTKYV